MDLVTWIGKATCAVLAFRYLGPQFVQGWYDIQNVAKRKGMDTDNRVEFSRRNG